MSESPQFLEVHRLAQLAHNLAMEASHKADNAIQSNEAHEKLCTERYNNIDKQLTKIERSQSDAAITFTATIEKIYIVLNELRGGASFNTGSKSTADHIFRYVCLAVGAALAFKAIIH